MSVKDKTYYRRVNNLRTAYFTYRLDAFIRYLYITNNITYYQIEIIYYSLRIAMHISVHEKKLRYKINFISKYL